MSRAWVSGILICALSRAGSATRARLVPGRDALADLDGHLLEHARHAGAHLEGVELAVAQRGLGFRA